MTGASRTGNRPDNEAIVAMEQAGVDVPTCGLGKAGTACIAPHSGSINHSKLAMFSTSGSAKRVVVFSSQNLTFQQNNYFNNAVVISRRHHR